MITSSECKRVVIVHGTLGYPGENWFPWLARVVERLGHQAVIPRLPTPDGQSLAHWLAAFSAQVPVLDEQTMLVGHSLGAPFALRCLEHSRHPVSHTFLVSGFVGALGLEPFDRLNETFFEEPVDWDLVRGRSRAFTSFHADNDPYVPLARGEYVAERLGAPLTIIPGGGHLNSAAGYDRFEELAAAVEAGLRR